MSFGSCRLGRFVVTKIPFFKFAYEEVVFVCVCVRVCACVRACMALETSLSVVTCVCVCVYVFIHATG